MFAHALYMWQSSGRVLLSGTREHLHLLPGILLPELLVLAVFSGRIHILSVHRML